jgi:hypothetical protein
MLQSLDEPERPADFLSDYQTVAEGYGGSHRSSVREAGKLIRNVE